MQHLRTITPYQWEAHFGDCAFCRPTASHLVFKAFNICHLHDLAPEGELSI
jgi:hypothetical protein